MGLATRWWVVTMATVVAVVSSVSMEDCEKWAGEGECKANPRFMLESCRAACIVAIPWGASADECEMWATEDDECSKNVGYMNLHCADACGHQWRWVPEVRKAMGLRAMPPAATDAGAAKSRPAPAMSGNSVDALKAAEWQCETLEWLVGKGALLPGVSVSEDTRSLLRGVAGALLYAARLLGTSEVADAATAALVVDDAKRRDWAAREMPNMVRNLRRHVDVAAGRREAAPDSESLYLEIVPKRRREPDTKLTGALALSRSGAEMPVLGLGTCWLNEAETETAVGAAARILANDPAHPGVHIDTAEAYRNEAAIGGALASLNADEKKAIDGRVFIGSKLSDEKWLSYDGARQRVEDALAKLGVERIDLFSLHSPFQFRASEAKRRAVAEAWRGLVSKVRDGSVRALGLSNFNEAELRDFAADPLLGGLLMPDVLQNKFDPYRRGEQLSFENDGDPLLAAKDLDLKLVAYSSLSGWPFGLGALADPFVHQLANYYRVQPSTLLLRWVLASGHAIIPRSKDPLHVAANLDVINLLPAFPSAAKDVLDGLNFLAANQANVPSQTSGAFDSLQLFNHPQYRGGSGGWSPHHHAAPDL